MHVAAGSQVRQADPLGVCSLACGAIGLGLGWLLWLVQGRPSLDLWGYGYELSRGGYLWEQAVWLTGTLGVGAIVAGLLSAAGGRPRAATPIGIVTGTIASIYPAMVWLGMVEAPLKPVLF